jgi:17 kDa common-antigen outer membrane protein
MTTRARCCAALALIAGCAAVITANGSNLGFLGKSPIAYFKPDDMALMRQSALKVLDAAEPNAKESWSNAKTGASGLAEVRSQFTATDGATCKRLRILNKVKGLESDATYTACKYPDRGWVMNTDAAPAK